MINFEDFIEEAWDYVSPQIISDDYWEKNTNFIREITHELYLEYKRGIVRDEKGNCFETLTPKICGRILESFFPKLIKF